MTFQLKKFLAFISGRKVYNKGDEIIELDAIFYRRIYRGDKKYIDKKTGRPTSRAFTPRPNKDDGKLSVDLSSLITPKNSCGDLLKFTLYSVTLQTINSIELKAIYDPVKYIFNNQEITNKAHSYITGFDEDDESKAGTLARSSKNIL